jgi:anti-sigma factor RsiW
MSPRRHVDDLFTGAYDDDLSPIDEARFQSHLRSCPDCSAGYMEFTATVEALRELPKARMARVVHLPSTAPVAEGSGRRRVDFGWLNAGLLRRFPVTAVAGAAAVVLIVFALAHNGGGTNSTSSIASGSGVAGAPAGDHGPVVPAAESACTQQLAPVAGATPPAGFSQPVVAKSLSQPGDHLDLAASSLSASPGQQVLLYAQLSEPLASAGAPGAKSTSPAIRAVRPCVSIGVGSGALLVLPTTANQSGDGAPGATTGDYVGNQRLGPSGSGSLVTFTVPAGLAPGTVIHVEAEIPAGFEFAGSRALTATLDITTR